MSTYIATDGDAFEVKHLDRGYGAGPVRTVLRVDGRSGDVEVIGRLKLNGAPILAGGQALQSAPLAAQLQHDHFAPAAGQTGFALSHGPNGEVQMFVNGARQQLGADFTVSGPAATWLNNGFQLGPTDDVVFTYPR